MKFDFYYFDKTPLCVAADKENLDIVKLLLKQPKIDANIKSISYNIFFSSRF